MKPNRPWRHVASAFLIALVLYVVAFSWFQYMRNHKGPWEVTFATDPAGVPGLTITQPALGLADIRLDFPKQKVAATNFTVRFDQAREVPYPVPFGECLFMDPTFLPGTVVFNCYGHEIQLLPRVLTVDQREIPWHNGLRLSLTNHAILPKPLPPKPAPGGNG